jgi:hypothetical protein
MHLFADPTSVGIYENQEQCNFDATRPNKELHIYGPAVTFSPITKGTGRHVKYGYAIGEVDF